MRGKEHDQWGYVPSTGTATRRYVAGEEVFFIPDTLTFRPADSQGIYPYVLRRPFQRESLGEGKHRAHAGTIGGAVGYSPFRQAGYNVNDTAGLLGYHIFAGCPGAKKSRGKVSLEHPLPLFFGHVQQGFPEFQVKTVNQDIDLTELRYGPCHHAFDFPAVIQVGGNTQDVLPGQSRRYLVYLFPVAGSHGNPGSGLVQRQGQLFNPAEATGSDDGYIPV